jgi:hypothetical protein
MLSAQNLVPYLLERGLVSRDSVVNGGVEISEIARRNRNFKVKQGNAPGYFLKHVRRAEPESFRTLQTEADCYRLIATEPSFADLAEVAPKFHSFDQRRAVLILELIEAGETVVEHYRRRGALPEQMAEQLGSAFGNYHRKANLESVSSLYATFPRRPAWVLSLHEMEPSALPDLSGGIHQMLGMVRQFPQFSTVLEKLRAEWRFDALIHGDIKWDNLLLSPGSNGNARLQIVDWEMADWGDGCWDLAGIFSAHLLFWIQSLPTNDMANPGTLAAQAQVPIESMHPATRSFWTAYRQCRGVSGHEAQELLRRTVLYTGARNLQTAFESLQFSAQANASTVLLLQLSMNVLAEPEEAARELLGIQA